MPAPVRPRWCATSFAGISVVATLPSSLSLVPLCDRRPHPVGPEGGDGERATEPVWLGVAPAPLASIRRRRFFGLHARGDGFGLRPPLAARGPALAVAF